MRTRCGKFTRRAAGLTVLEAVLAISLFFLAMAAIGGLFIHVARFSGAGEQRNVTNQSRLGLAAVLRRALAGSVGSGNTMFYQTAATEPDDLAISLLTTHDAEGQPGWNAEQQRPLFRAYLIFYRDSSERSLKQIRVDIAETSVAASLTPEQVRTSISTTPGRALASSVDAFRLVSTEDGTVLEQAVNLAALQVTQTTARGTPVVTEVPFRFPTF